MTGRTLLRRTEGSQQGGSHLLELDLSALPAGMYLCRLHTTAGSTSIKLVKQ